MILVNGTYVWLSRSYPDLRRYRCGRTAFRRFNGTQREVCLIELPSRKSNRHLVGTCQEVQARLLLYFFFCTSCLLTLLSVYGDMTVRKTLKHAGAHRAKKVVILPSYPTDTHSVSGSFSHLWRHVLFFCG